MGDATNRKYDSHGNLIEWTDGRGWTHVDTKQIAKDLNRGSDPVDSDLGNNSHHSTYAPQLSPGVELIIMIAAIAVAVAVFIGILVFSSMFLNWIGVLVLGIIMFGLFGGILFVVYKCCLS